MTTKHRERDSRKRERRSLRGRKSIDVSHLLQIVQDGVEGAEALLARPERPTTSWWRQTWDEACYGIEQLEELRLASALPANQAEKLANFVRRVERLVPELQRRDWREPRIEWPEER